MKIRNFAHKGLKKLRLTFRIDIAEREIFDLNLEDYH